MLFGSFLVNEFQHCAFTFRIISNWKDFWIASSSLYALFMHTIHAQKMDSDEILFTISSGFITLEYSRIENFIWNSHPLLNFTMLIKIIACKVNPSDAKQNKTTQDTWNPMHFLSAVFRFVSCWFLSTLNSFFLYTKVYFTSQAIFLRFILQFS